MMISRELLSRIFNNVPALQIAVAEERWKLCPVYFPASGKLKYDAICFGIAEILFIPIGCLVQLPFW